MSKNSVPTRMCSGCMTRRPKNELLRIVCIDGVVSVDTSGKSMGRGAYVCPDANCILKSEKKKWFSKSFKCEVDKSIYQKLLSFASEE